MNKNVSKESKLKLLDFLEEELEVRKATVKNLLRNNRNEKERCSSSLESSEDNLAILIDCERSFRRFMKDLGELDENLKILKAWRSEISDSEI